MTEKKIPVEMDGGFCILLAMMLLVLPLQWVGAAMLAAFVHESFHYVAVTLLGGRIYGLRLGLRGAAMETEPLPPGRELAAAAAGPVGSALLIFLAPWLPRTAVCGIVHCLFNLLPLFPLDGGRIARSLLALLFKNGEGAFRVFQRIVRTLLALVALWCGLRFGIWFAVAGILLLLGLRRRELFDKRRFCGYNSTDIERQEVGL